MVVITSGNYLPFHMEHVNEIFIAILLESSFLFYIRKTVDSVSCFETGGESNNNHDCTWIYTTKIDLKDMKAFVFGYLTIYGINIVFILNHWQACEFIQRFYISFCCVSNVILLGKWKFLKRSNSHKCIRNKTVLF